MTQDSYTPAPYDNRPERPVHTPVANDFAPKYDPAFANRLTCGMAAAIGLIGIAAIIVKMVM